MDRRWMLHGGMAILSCISGTDLVAGVWSGGGGELIKDANNPWFLSNTTEVHYCLDMDEAHFGVDKARSEEIIVEAIEAWKREFAASSSDGKGLVGTQSFVPAECDEKTDIVFQFGTLSDKQKAYLGDPTQIVGVAIRTDYDPVRLRGKGFIYIAPQSGDLALRGERVIDSYWSRGDQGRLRWALLHELGHVFGLGHSTDLMAPDFTERMVSPNGKLYETLWGERPGFLAPLMYDLEINFGRGGLPRQGVFFGFAPEWSSMRVSRKGDIMQISARPMGREDDLGWQLIGTATLGAPQASPVGPTIGIYLTAAQMVFPPNSDVFYRYVLSRSHILREATYKSVDGRVSRPLYLSMDVDGYTIAGFADGRLIPNVIADSADLNQKR